MKGNTIWWILGGVVVLVILYLLFTMNKSSNQPAAYNPTPAPAANPNGGQSKLADILSAALPYFNLIEANKAKNSSSSSSSGSGSDGGASGSFWSGSGISQDSMLTNN
jgi:hypothetical protein